MRRNDPRSPGIFDMQLLNTVYIQSTCTYTTGAIIRQPGRAEFVSSPASGQGSGGQPALRYRCSRVRVVRYMHGATTRGQSLHGAIHYTAV